MRTVWLGGLMAVSMWAPCEIAAAADVMPGPLMRAALASLETDQAKSSPARSGKSRTDWLRVTRLRPGGEIILTVKGRVAATHRLLRADDDGLVVLDTGATSLPDPVRKALAETADNRPDDLLSVPPGMQRQLSRRVRMTDVGVFFDEQRVASLADVVKKVPRPEVIDMRVRRKHIGSHTRRGVLIGAAVGAAIAASSAGACGSECSVGTLAAIGALGGAVVGLEIGAIVGIVAPRSADVIYHVD